MKEKMWKLFGITFTIIIAFILNYFMLPAWNFKSVGLWFFILLMSIIAIVIQAIISVIFKEKKSKIVNSIAVIIIVIVIILIVGGVSSSYLLNANRYKNLITIQEGKFEEDINSVENVKNISIVDMETAQKVGDRTAGSIKNATWYEVGNEYNLIKYNGELYRISELEYGGFFKAQKAKQDGIPGYVLVNTASQEAKYIELKNPIKYAPSAYFSYDLTRHLRKQFPSYILGTSFFEIDEEGNPYYITAVVTKTIGLFGGSKEESFIITNASTGESNEYRTESLPDWVDHAFDLNYLMNTAADNFRYIKGYWNSVFSQTDILNLTFGYSDYGYAGYNTVITANGDIVFYTGLTPASNSESNVGFVLLNPRTGVITKYNTYGAEESSAQSSAESLVQDLKYTATFPTVLNVEGKPTYFMLLKDKAGLVQRYALCNVENYTKVVQSDNLNEAIILYKQKIGMEIEKESEILSKEGKINNLYQAVIDGNTYYFFTIDNQEELYMSSIKNNNKQVLLKQGMQVRIEYTKQDSINTVQKIEF